MAVICSDVPDVKQLLARQVSSSIVVLCDCRSSFYVTKVGADASLVGRAGPSLAIGTLAESVPIEPLRAGRPGRYSGMTTASLAPWNGTGERRVRRNVPSHRRCAIGCVLARPNRSPGTLVLPLSAKRFLMQVSEQGKAPTTTFAYEYAAERHIAPGLGGLRVHELTVGTVHRFLRSVAEHHGPGTAKMCRSVLSGMCGLAARHDALDRNPVRDVDRSTTGRGNIPRSLSAAEARQLRALLTYDAKAVERDLPDFVAMMLATGLRIGECAALRWEDLDLKAGTVTVRSTVVRLKGRGLTVKPTKSAAEMRTLAVPSWRVQMLSLRRRTDSVFRAPMGGWRDPSNTQADLREVFGQAGFG
jgi:site-specific recombinase XerC